MRQTTEVDLPRLYALLDRIPQHELRAVEKILRAFAEEDDPVTRALCGAPPDADPVSRHEREALTELEFARAQGTQLRSTSPDRLLEAFGFDESS